MRIFTHLKLNRIDVLDERFYTEDKETYYPSTTTVLDAYPKGKAFKEWLKSNGHSADIIMDRAAERGTKVHDAIEKYINGADLNWFAPDGKMNFELDEWQMVCRYMDFHKDYLEGSELAAETQLFSHKLKLGGTADLVCEINGETWLIDFKTGKNSYKTHELQLAVYKEMWDEKNDPKIDRYGILYLDTAHRTKKQFQGIGWQLKEFTKDHEKNFRLYQHTRALWNEENPNYKPKNLSYPNTFKRAV